MKSLAANVLTLLFSLLIAVLIWGVAVRESDPTRQLSLEIPVQVIGKPADSEVSNVPNTVEIRVEGAKSVLDQLATDDFTAEIDLTEVPAGESTVPINVRSEEDQVEILLRFPEEVTVRIERVITRDIPVSVEVRGSVARGHVRDEAFTDPERIQVTGAASRVELLTEARVTVFLDNAREEVVVSRRPSFYDRQGNITSVNGLSLSAEEVVVTVSVNELAGYAAKPIIVNWEGEPAEGYRLLDVSVTPDSVLVTGPPDQLDSLTRLGTEPVDITGLKESVTLEVTLDLPERVVLDEVQPVIVEIEIEPILTSSVVRTPPEVRGLEEGLTATVDVEEVSVFLFGPLDKLDSLLDEDVRVTLDLFGLDVGTHSVEPSADVFVTDVEVRSVQPPQISVNITRTLTTTNGLTETESAADTTSLLPGVPAGSSLPLALSSLALLAAPVALAPAGITAHKREELL